MDLVTCFTNVCQSVSDNNGVDGLNWFSPIGPDLSGIPLWSEHAETICQPLDANPRDYLQKLSKRLSLHAWTHLPHISSNPLSVAAGAITDSYQIQPRNRRLKP